MEEMNMRSIAIAFGALALAATASAGTGADNIYRNMLAEPGLYFPTGNEYGDKITLGTGSRNLTSFTIAYTADIDSPQNDEVVKIRIYDATGPNGGPGNLLWESNDLPIRPGIWNKTVVINGGVTVPDDIIYTAQFKNMANAEGDRAGLVLSNPPTRGSSEDNFWMFDMGSWGSYQFGGPTPPVANFQASFWVDGAAPQPYQNENPNLQYYFPGFFEPADQIDLEGTKRTITKVRFPIYCPGLTNPGDEELVVRLWKLDGPDQEPGTLLWESAPAPFIADINNLQLFEFNVPNIVVEDAIAWSVEFRGVTQSSPPNPTDNAGVLITGNIDTSTSTRVDFEPQLGSSQNFFLGRNVPGSPLWDYFWFGPTGPQSNFEFSMEATGVTKVQPNAFQVLTGVQTGGNLNSLMFNDNDRLIVREAPPLALGLPSVNLQVDGVSPTANPNAITIRVIMNTSGAPAGSVNFRVIGVLGNNTTELLATSNGTSADQTIVITPTGDLSRFVQTGSNRLRIRLQMFDPGTLFSFGWLGRFNQVSWEIE